MKAYVTITKKQPPSTAVSEGQNITVLGEHVSVLLDGKWSAQS
ncbi:hypothetical protein PO124_21990 [Bacillus licheniformis]|nr:hypothetical protein [Bacillus licheniformis]